VTNRERMGEREMECVNKRYHQKEREMECVNKRYPKERERDGVKALFFLSITFSWERNDQIENHLIRGRRLRLSRAQNTVALYYFSIFL
jgi:hypothetical protein